MEGIPVRIQGEPDVVAEVVELLAESPDAEVLGVEEDELGGVGADFDLATVATVLGVFSTLFMDGPLVPGLWKMLKRRKGTKLTIETPTRTVRLESSDDLTAEQVSRILATLLPA